jgi:hypothetical protein
MASHIGRKDNHMSSIAKFQPGDPGFKEINWDAAQLVA